MQEFFKKFEDYCKTPGVDSGKARSYAKAIEYLCDYLKITASEIVNYEFCPADEEILKEITKRYE